MNAEQIRKMEAGREMDALVAVEVMGWERHGNEIEGVWIVPPEGDERRAWCASWDNRGIPDWMPQFSRDIAVAWEVVEKMRGSWHFGLSWTDDSGWGASFCRNPTDIGYEHFHKAYADTAPLAICRAALLAVMGDES